MMPPSSKYSDTPPPHDNGSIREEEPDRSVEASQLTRHTPSIPVTSTHDSVGVDNHRIHRPWYLLQETKNFIIMSLMFSANHGCVVACLSLATARLGGDLGAWQSGLLYATYSISGIAGSTYVVKELGSRDALMTGMALYCCYVSAFWLAIAVVPEWKQLVATIGGLVGGVGAGFLWTAQGAYFAQSAQAVTSTLLLAQRNHDTNDDQADSDPVSTDTSLEAMTAQLASLFAVIYLASEVGLRALSTVLLKTLHMTWSSIFAIYALVALGSTFAMVWVHKFPDDDDDDDDESTTEVDDRRASIDADSSELLLMPRRRQQQSSNPTIAAAHLIDTTSTWYKVTAAWQLLRRDRKMPLMIGLNAAFGITSSFVTSYVNGQVAHTVLHSDAYVGALTAWVSCVAATFSAIFGRVSLATGKGPILMMGALCFAAVAAPFVVFPVVAHWHWTRLVWVYTMHGIGRATFEGTLKATFADFFGETDKEGAFANIIFQNGISSTVGFLLTFTLHCSDHQKSSPYCVVYRDGSVHDVLSFEIIIMITAVVAIAGYWRASQIRAEEIVRNRYNTVSSDQGSSRSGE